MDASAKTIWTARKDLLKRRKWQAAPLRIHIARLFAVSRLAQFTGKPQQTKTQICVEDAPSVLPIGSLAFSIKKTMRLSLRSVISTLSPVSRMRLGMSITDSGSVHNTSSRSPAASDFNAFRVFNAGNGHFRPARSSFV